MYHKIEVGLEQRESNFNFRKTMFFTRKSRKYMKFTFMSTRNMYNVVFGVLFGTSENRNTFHAETLRYDFNVKYPWRTWIKTSSEVFEKFVRRICVFYMPSLENFSLILTISEGEVSFLLTHVRHCLCYQYFVSKFEERTKTGSLYSELWIFSVTYFSAKILMKTWRRSEGVAERR